MDDLGAPGTARTRLESAVGSAVRPAQIVDAQERALELSRLSLAANGAATLLVLCAAVVLNRVKLPHDQQFHAVIYLMWSGNQDDHWIVLVILLILLAITILSAALLLAGALVVPQGRTLYRQVVAKARHDGLHLSMWLLLTLNLSRYVANLLYEIAEHVTWDVTPVIASIEGSYLESLQAFGGFGVTAEITAWLYSVGWYVPILLAAPLAQACGRQPLVAKLLLATVLTALLAMPVFLAFPIFEPWVLNPVYGYQGSGPVAVAYAYPGADRAALHFVATELRWATGACLPSLHVAFPLVYALIFARARLQTLGAVYGLLAGFTAIGVVVLGRHWIIDIVLAAPYALAVVAITERLTRHPRVGTAEAG